MDDKDKKNIEDLAQNSDLALEQGQKMIESIEGLEPIFEGILVKLDELPIKMGQPNKSSNEEVIKLLSEFIAQSKEPIDISVTLNLV